MSVAPRNPLSKRERFDNFLKSSMTHSIGPFSGLPVYLMHWFQKRKARKEQELAHKHSSSSNKPKTNHRDESIIFTFPPANSSASEDTPFQPKDMKSMDQGFQAINNLLLSVVGRQYFKTNCFFIPKTVEKCGIAKVQKCKMAREPF